MITLVWIWGSQSQMGNSWRIGIDIGNKTELVKSGVFSISRNPIFLGIKVNVIGFFLVMPNAVTLVVLIATIILIDVQVVLEEEYLLKVHGDSYSDYCQEVKRWI